MLTRHTPGQAATAVLDLADIQGLVLRGYRQPFGSYTFLRIVDPQAAGNWTGDLIGHITTAAPWEGKPASTVNVAFSHAGLRVLGLPGRHLASFSAPFQAGMAARAAILGDWGDSAPQHWVDGLGGTDVHILVLIGATDAASLAERERWLAGRLEAGGLRTVSRQEVASLPTGREHFGYADGFSQPTVEGVGPAPRTGQAALDGRGGWRPVRAGEFVLGYPDEENILPAAPTPPALALNGSYLVYRKLHQDVAAFRRTLAAAARRYPGGEEMLAAKLVGRWRDGTPLELSPAAADSRLADDPDRNNSFGYADDLDGYRCPAGAHIRRANPRDSLPFEGRLVNRHRLIRRGLPYGRPLPPGARDDGEDRGVIFICFNADIKRQFEFVQSQWLNDGNAFRLGADKDVLVGDHEGTGKATVQGAPPHFVHPLSRVVTVKGGEYFFAPGIGGLHYLSALPAPTR